ncbi:MAG: hypothetical protein EOP48_06645 [Sphingobacteriales bacterium]|nr:MAG: hypothetical protein EOP48_06645 [Sphingobacteriales bacterium]
MRTFLLFLPIFFFASCTEKYDENWESSIIDLDSIRTDALTRKVAVASYLDSVNQQTFLDSLICLSPIIDTSTEYLNELFTLPDSIKSKFHRLFDRSKFLPVDLRNFSEKKESWCNLASDNRPGGIVDFYNACRVGDQATVTVVVDVLPKAGKVFTLFLEKDASEKWKTRQVVELAVF